LCAAKGCLATRHVPGHAVRRENRRIDSQEAIMAHMHTFHPGERAVQQRAGESAVADRNRALISDVVVGGARPFIAQQSMVVVGSADDQGRPWASLVSGEPGFVHADDGMSIRIDTMDRGRDTIDPVWNNLRQGRHVGLLFIELGSRRRYRVNGVVSGWDERGADVTVREAYPNCPKYIQRRRLRTLGGSTVPVQAASGTVLRGSVADIVRVADTAFVASQHPEHGVDASHRGGDAGFIRLVDASTLRLPDYPGNGLFNTLGNFAIDPRAGLCIPDFENGRILQLTGRATLQWDPDASSDETGGTGRYWEFHVERWILHEGVRRAEWEYLDASPYNPPVVR
jgi:predicted pyridoxine 5'-phosphate oxidase superfamily flavin-nucleotide-binding protein